MSNSSGTYRPGDGLQNWEATVPPSVQPGPLLSGYGSPEGYAEGNPGQGYTDLETNKFYVKYVGVSVLGWKAVGVSVAAIFAGKSGSVFSGSSLDPNGVLTATGPAYYYSTTDQSQWEKTSVVLSNTGWVKFLG